MNHKILSPATALRIISVKNAPPQIIYKQEDKLGNARVTLYAPESQQKSTTLHSKGLFLIGLSLLCLGAGWFFLPPLVKFQVSASLERFAFQSKKYALIEAFHSPEKEVRFQAAQTLSSLGTSAQPLLPSFEFALADEDEEVRNQVALAFGKIDPERNSLVPQIVSSSDENTHSRSVSKKTPADVFSEKQAALEKQAASISQEIPKTEEIKEIPPEHLKVSEIPKLNIEENVESLKEAIAKKTEIVKIPPQKISSPKIDSQKIQPYLQMLRSSDADTRMRARFALSEFGESVLPSLSQSFQDDSYEFRREAGLVLGKMGEMAVPILIEVLQHENWSNRYIAADTLNDLGPKASPAVSYLAKTVQDSNRNVQEASLKALGGMGAKAQVAVPILLETLSENSTYLRILAAEALLKIGANSSQAKQVLLEIQKSHENEKLREQAKEVLRNS